MSDKKQNKPVLIEDYVAALRNNATSAVRNQVQSTIKADPSCKQTAETLRFIERIEQTY